MQIRGYLNSPPQPGREDDEGADRQQIAADLYQALRGQDNLVFANARSEVELLAARLRDLCEAAGVPNEFFPHHGNLSKELREDVEAALKDRGRPTTAVATTTLEMGIDIGSVHSVAQIGAPPSVAALRQRLGRSGRRGRTRDPAHLRDRAAGRPADVARPTSSAPSSSRASRCWNCCWPDGASRPTRTRCTCRH